MVFEEDLGAFSNGLDKALSFLKQDSEEKTKSGTKEKSYRLKDIRKQYPRAYEKWEPEEDDLLAEKYYEGLSVAEIAAFLERKPGAIRARLNKIDLTK
jgi:DNA-directed RNA polymerase specialized sigma24 family protein